MSINIECVVLKFASRNIFAHITEKLVVILRENLLMRKYLANHTKFGMWDEKFVILRALCVRPETFEAKCFIVDDMTSTHVETNMIR